MKTYLFASLGLAALVVAAALAQQASGATPTTLKPVADVRIVTDSNSATPDLNFNSPAQLSAFNYPNIVNYQRSLIRFDLASLPTGYAVQSATLTLYSKFENGLGNPNGATMSLYRVTQPWTETEATWNDRDWGANHVNDTPGPGDDHPWTTPGGDFVGTTGVRLVSPYAISNAQPAGENLPVTWDVTTLVNEWYAGTHENDGLLVMSDSYNSLTFRSREYDDGVHGAGYWSPRLDVTLTPEPATLTLLTLGGLAVLGRRRAIRR
jgi:Disaggregatase related repeat/PEP-CTERM motif